MSGRAEPLPECRLRQAGSLPSILSPSFFFPPLHFAGVAHGSTRDCFWARHPKAGAERGRRRDVSPGWGCAAMDQLNGRVRGLNSQWCIFLSMLPDGTGTLVLWWGCLPDPPNIPSHPALHAPMWALSHLVEIPAQAKLLQNIGISRLQLDQPKGFAPLRNWLWPCRFCNCEVQAGGRFMPRVQDLSFSSHRGEWQEVPRASESMSCIRQGPRESGRHNLQLSHMHGLRKEKQGWSQPPDVPAP